MTFRGSPKALLFPGQGSQRIGMGRELAASLRASRDVFERVDEALGEFLSRLMFGDHGRDASAQKRLTETRNAQPAILAHSMAMLAAIDETGFRSEVCPCGWTRLKAEILTETKGIDAVPWALARRVFCSLCSGIHLPRGSGTAHQKKGRAHAECLPE